MTIYIHDCRVPKFYTLQGWACLWFEMYLSSCLRNGWSFRWWRHSSSEDRASRIFFRHAWVGARALHDSYHTGARAKRCVNTFWPAEIRPKSCALKCSEQAFRCHHLIATLGSHWHKLFQNRCRWLWRWGVQRWSKAPMFSCCLLLPLWWSCSGSYWS